MESDARRASLGDARTVEESIASVPWAYPKKEHRLGLNYLKGAVGATINVVLAAAAWNLRKWKRETAIA